MASQVKIRVLYEDEHLEEFTILPDTTVEWTSTPGKMTLAHRKRFDRILEELHILMLDASIKKIEIEEETIDGGESS